MDSYSSKTQREGILALLLYKVRTSFKRNPRKLRCESNMNADHTNSITAFNFKSSNFCADEFSNVLFKIAARKGGNFYSTEQDTFPDFMLLFLEFHHHVAILFTSYSLDSIVSYTKSMQVTYLKTPQWLEKTSSSAIAPQTFSS